MNEEKTINDIINASDIAEFLSNSLKIRRPEGFLPPEEKFGYNTGAFTTPSRPKDYYDYLENLEDMAAEGEEVRATDENLVKYYLSKFQGSSPTGMSRNPVTEEMESNYVNKMRMFGDRSKKEGRYVMGDPRNEELRDAFAVKEHLEQGKSFDKLGSGLKNQVVKRAKAFNRKESDSLNNFFDRYYEDIKTNPMSPNYRMQEAPMPNIETESAQSPSILDLLKTAMSGGFR